MHYRPPTSTRGTLDCPTHPTRSPIQPSTQSCNQALPVRPGHRQGHRPCDSSLPPMYCLAPNPENARGAVIFPSTWCRWRIICCRRYQVLETAHSRGTWVRDLLHSHNSTGGWAAQHSTWCPNSPLCPDPSTWWAVSRHTYRPHLRLQGTNGRPTTKTTELP